MENMMLDLVTNSAGMAEAWETHLGATEALRCIAVILRRLSNSSLKSMPSYRRRTHMA